uniref:Type II toxin-antitoxin system HicA family toxin n=1 Tax=Heterorhabditis bacteriophora TaxID=37862 RepID=A0A1I7XG91_HETBA
MRKTLAISLGNGSLKDRCIRPDYEHHIFQLTATGRFPTKRELKQYLDDLTTNLAS